MPIAARVNQFVLEIVTLNQPAARVNQFVLELATLAVPVTIACGGPPNGTVGAAYSHTFPASGGLAPLVYSIVVPALPPGLTLNPATGVVSGIPTAAGSYTFSIQVTDANLTSSVVACGFSVSGTLPVKITLRGVNRRPKLGCGDVQVNETIRELPSVKRAV